MLFAIHDYMQSIPLLLFSSFGKVTDLALFFGIGFNWGFNLRTPLSRPPAKFSPIGLRILFWIDIAILFVALPPAPLPCFCRHIPILWAVATSSLFNSSVLSFMNNTWIEFPPGGRRALQTSSEHPNQSPPPSLSFSLFSVLFFTDFSGFLY